MRRCCRCKEIKRLEDFPKEKGKTAGRSYICNICNRLRNNLAYRRRVEMGIVDPAKKKRWEVFKRDKFTCQYCGRFAPNVILHVDHIVPKSKGGKNDLNNLIAACEDCNYGKSDDTVDAK